MIALYGGPYHGTRSWHPARKIIAHTCHHRWIYWPTGSYDADGAEVWTPLVVIPIGGGW